MAICLVTGGAGFVGSHLVDTLLAQGQQVRVLDDFSTGTRTNLPASNPRLEIIHSDLNDPQTVAHAAEGVEHVFHLAIPSQASYEADIPLNRWACTTDTLNVLSAAHKARVKRFIYSSCESVYGPPVARRLVETDPTLPLSPYAFAKLAGEQQCVAFSAMFGLETVRLRYFNVFGRRQVSSGARPAAIFQILKSMLLGHNPTIEGDGCEPQDFIYVDDVVHANLLAARAPRVSGKVYNIARGRPTTLNQVVATINALLGTNLQPHYQPGQDASRGSRLTDIARAEADLGFCPGTDVEQGLRRTIAYYKAHPEELSSVPRAVAYLHAGPHFARNGSEVPEAIRTDTDAGAPVNDS
jgi:UDP-glucose 4-epimerase